jgi:hypothetical protein
VILSYSYHIENVTLDWNVNIPHQETAEAFRSTLNQVDMGIDPSLITPMSPLSSSSQSSATSSSTSSEDEASRPPVTNKPVTRIFEDSGGESEPRMRTHKPKPTPRIRVVDSSEDQAPAGPSGQRTKVMRPRPKHARAPDLPVPTTNAIVQERIPAIKVVKPDKCSREGVHVTFHRAIPDQDPLKYEFRVWERTVRVLMIAILTWQQFNMGVRPILNMNFYERL